MISIVITSAFEEHESIKKSLDCILNQEIPGSFEIFVVTPDIKTKTVVLTYKRRYPHLHIITDPFFGKPYALNLVLEKVSGDLLILTDGDVYLGNVSIKALVDPFRNPKVGIVSGRPVSLNPRSDKFGYFSHLLTDLGAHETRILRRKERKMIVCSGYLYAFRKKLFIKFPESILAEDALISHLISEMGYETVYAPSALVYVKYPTNFRDWINQKRRSAGGYNQLKYFVKSNERMRSFYKEIGGITRIFRYPQTLKEFLWTFELIIYRLYLWFLIFVDVNIKKKNFKEIWVKIDSTK